MKKYFLICVAMFIILLLFMIRIAFSADIDVGSAVIDRSAYSQGLITIICKENPANATGTIDHIDIFMKQGGTVDIAAFQQVDTNIFTTRGVVAGLTTVVGDNNFNAPGDFTAFEINAGDYIGICLSASTVVIDKDNVGEGCWYTNSDRIPCTNITFIWLANRTFSLYATGTTGEGEAIEVGPQILILD